MPLNISQSSQSHEIAAHYDRRIAVAVLSAMTLFLIFFSKHQLSQYFSSFFGIVRPVQLQWKNGMLSCCTPPHCQTTEMNVSRNPEITPFFFEPVPINLADAQLIETVDGIGPHLASEILRLRNEGMVFRGREDLSRVPGIGPKRLLKFERQFSFIEAR